MTKAEVGLRNKQIPIVGSEEEVHYFMETKKMLESAKGRCISNREFVMNLCHKYRRDEFEADKETTDRLLETNEDTLLHLKAIIDKQIRENEKIKTQMNEKEDE